MAGAERWAPGLLSSFHCRRSHLAAGEHIMAEDARVLLEECRSNTERWQALACADGTDAEGYWTDPQATLRYRVLLALQYDLQLSDDDLVAYLFDQEVRFHSKVPFQGLYASLDLAGYLLASFRNPQHVRRFWRATHANFDTYCGFDREYLLSAGIEPTLAFVRRREEPEDTDVLTALLDGETPRYTAAELEAWWTAKRTKYPTSVDLESVKTRLTHALALGERDDAAHWLRLWEASQERTPTMLHTLAYYLGQMHDWTAAAAALREYLLAIEGMYSTPWIAAASTIQLAEYERLAGCPSDAWNTIRTLVASYPEHDEASHDVLARSVPEALALADVLPADDQTCREAFDWAYHQLQRGIGHTIDTLVRADMVARKLSETARAATCQEWLQQERERVRSDYARSLRKLPEWQREQLLAESEQRMGRRLSPDNGGALD